MNEITPRTPKVHVPSPSDYDLVNWPHTVIVDEVGMADCQACTFLGDLGEGIAHVVKNPPRVIVR